MSTENHESSPRDKYAEYGLRVVQKAVNSGRLANKETIDSHKVHKGLRPKSKDAYFRVYAVWVEYEKQYPGSDPRDMKTMKHFAEVVALGLGYKLDQETEMPTVISVRGVMRRFYNQWERLNHCAIDNEVKESMAPYIEGVLAEKLGLSRSVKDKAFLTISTYVNLYDHLWVRDNHEYRYEGSRVDASTLLNIYCYSSARQQEVCGAKYQDLICIIGWKDGEPDIKLDFKREICKGLDYKKPEHPFAERFQDGELPPLFSQPMLWWLANFLSSGAFKDYKTIDDIFSVRPPDGETFWMLDWDDSALKRPVFPQWTVEGRVEVPKNAKAWGNDASDWAKRAGYFGFAIHAVRRESLIRVNDSGASIGQVLKFAAQKNPSVLGNHYLHDLTTVDGASCYLGMKPRTDLTEDFRTATMRRNPDVGQSLPSSMRHELRQRGEYVLITNNIEDLSHQIKKTVDEDKLRKLKADRATAYRQRDILEKEELTKLRENTKRVHPAQRGQQHQGDGQHRKKDETEFDRIRHMMPERDRLSRTLFLRVSIRSPEGRSAMQDLINLRTQDSQVAYQEVLKPNKGCCPVGSCGRQMREYSFPDRSAWQRHISCCSSRYFKRQKPGTFIPCPLSCQEKFPSQRDLWHHLEDSSVSASPLRADNSAHASESCSGNSTPLSEMFDFDMASSTMASSCLSPRSSDASTFCASRNRFPRESSLLDFAIDPALQSQSSALSPTTNTDTEFLEDKSAPAPNMESVGADPHDPISLLSGSTGLPSKDNQDTAVAPRKLTRIVIKVPGTRTPGAKYCPDEDGKATHGSSGEGDVYEVDCLLDKWSNWFFVRWFDGSCTWEPRENIRDNELIRTLNREHGGLKWGVEVLQARRESRGIRYLVRWKGGKWKDQWIHERYMCQELIEKHRPEKKVRRRRKN
ncbi:hypothetical protein GE09DRAFT_1033211 [Coniochaeta sp. 2T2.1]|nr:hypothetical protein GE09DRAFT_1033211 [Coniochaeta sp. 2T2.1]